MFEALIRSGSLERIGANRATLSADLDRAMHLGEQNSRAMSVGQEDLFGFARGRVGSGRRVERGPAAGRRARDAGTVPERSSNPPYEPDLKFLGARAWSTSAAPSP